MFFIYSFITYLHIDNQPSQGYRTFLHGYIHRRILSRWLSLVRSSVSTTDSFTKKLPILNNPRIVPGSFEECSPRIKCSERQPPWENPPMKISV